MKVPIPKTSHHDTVTGPALRLELPSGESGGDAERLSRIRAGDVAAFEAVVRAHAPGLVAFAYRYVRSRELAADLAQDVFAQIWERRESLDVRGSIRAYLYGAVRNRALNAIRRDSLLSRWRDTESTRDPANGRAAPSADRPLEEAELLTALHAALASLPPRTREVARLRWQEEMSYAEIATVMEITVSTVSNQLLRAAKRMRALLAGVWP